MEKNGVVINDIIEVLKSSIKHHENIYKQLNNIPANSVIIYEITGKIDGLKLAVLPNNDNSVKILIYENMRKDEVIRNSPVSVNYLKNKYMIEDLQDKSGKIEAIDTREIFGYERGFDRASLLFNKTLSESHELMHFLQFIDKKTNWKDNPDATNKEVIRAYLNYKYE